jgi:transposase-like protein
VAKNSVRLAGEPTIRKTRSEICRRHGIHPNTLRNWKAKYGGLDASDVVRMRRVEAAA